MKSSVKPIKRRRLTDQIVDQLVSLIARVKLKKGDRLPVEFVAVSPDEFLSRALSWRVQMGREKIEELIEARIVLEQAITGLAAVKATEADIAEIGRYLEQMKKMSGKRTQLKFKMIYHFTLP